MKNIIDKVIKKFYVRGYYYKLDLCDAQHIDLDGHRLVELDEDTLDVMKKEYQNELTDRKYNILKSRLDENSSEKAYVVINKENEVCGYYNIAYKEVYSSVFKCNMPDVEGNVHLFDQYTFVKHRKKGIHTFAVGECINVVKDQGYKSATTCIVDKNIPSEKTNTKIGFKKYKKIDTYKLKKLNKRKTKKL